MRAPSCIMPLRFFMCQIRDSTKEAIGYVGAYFGRSGGKKDGCATFVKKDLRVVREERVPFNVPGHPVLDRWAP